MSRFSNMMQGAMKKIVPLLPDRMVPGGKPDVLTGGLIGAAVSRVDGARKVMGAAPFAAEFAMEGMLHGALAFSTIAKGRVTAIDTVAAGAAPGVRFVMTHENAPKLAPIPHFMETDKAGAGDNLPVMQDERIHWNGQPIAIVLADTHEQAEHAASLIRAQYAEEPSVTSFAEARSKGLEVANFQGERLEHQDGDAAAALAAAPHKIDAVYKTPRYNHNAIELHGVTVAWRDGELFVHDATQAVAHTAWSLGTAFGLEETQVHVTSPFVGGGFGGKMLWQHHVLACAASRLVARPVRMVLSREGVYRLVGGRTCTEQRVALGAQADGRLDALIHTGVVAVTAHSNVPEPFITPAQCLYQAKTFELRVQSANVDMLANTFMRAPGESVGTFALESAMDELAHELGIDPIELRVRNEPEKDPTLDLPFSMRNLVEAYRRGAEKFGWQRTPPRSRREGEWLIGTGVATSTYPYYRMPGGAARITLARDGSVVVATAAHEMGMGTATVQSQLAAERLGLPLERVRFEYADSSLPGVILAGGSQQTASIGAAVAAARLVLVEELLKLCGEESPLHGLSPDEVVSRDDGLAAGDAHERYDAILARAGRDQLVAEGKSPQPIETMHWSTHSYGAMFCEVGVSAITGEVRVRRFVGSFDCGRILNAKTASSQFRGGIIMGLGLALMEETRFDERSGRVMNPSLSEYHVPVHADVPDIDVIWNDLPDEHTPAGAHGIGEIGITGTAAAVANAVFNATGKRIRELPITLDKLM